MRRRGSGRNDQSIARVDGRILPVVSIVTAAGVVKKHVGEVLAIIHQGALYGKRRTILSPTHMEAFDVSVSDKHKIDGGLQCIVARLHYPSFFDT